MKQLRAQQKVRASFPPTPVPRKLRDTELARAFDQALRRLAPGAHGGLNHKRLAEIFEHRVTRRAVAHWRLGTREIPEWAVVCVLRERDKNAHAFDQLRKKKNPAG